MKSVLFSVFLFFASVTSVANPHPYLLWAAQIGSWDDFKNFLYEHPEEAERCDDSIFSLAHLAGRMDVFDGQPSASAPPFDIEPANNNYNPIYPQAPTAPELSQEEIQEEEDSQFARRLQEEEYAPQQPSEYVHVDDQAEFQRRKVCSLNQVIPGAAAAVGAFIIWTLMESSNLIKAIP